MSVAIARLPVSYESRLAMRPLSAVDLLVIHCTELPDLELARSYAERIHYPATQTGACGHYYIGKDGRALEYVRSTRVAHHCVGYNERSIGIELDNPGRYPDWHHAQHQQMRDPYPAAQIDALLDLLDGLLRDLPELRWIAGHEELDLRLQPAADDPQVQIRRKLDPGPLFPWAQIEAHLAGRLRHLIPPTAAG